MRDLIIVGGGPAGIGAALQARHMGLDALVLERERLGGRLAHAREVMNFPLFSGSGTGLVRRLTRQLRRRGLEVATDECVSIDFDSGRFILRCRGRDRRAKSVIVATGVVPRSLPGLHPADAAGWVARYWDQLPVKKGSNVAVIGGGETAFDQACSLAERGARVSIVMRGLRPRAFPGLVREARRLGVRVRAGFRIKRADCGPGGCSITDRTGRTLHTDHILPAIGSAPCLPEINGPAGNRIGKGLWPAGDAAGGSCRQAAAAFGDGLRAAMCAYSFLKDRQTC